MGIDKVCFGIKEFGDANKLVKHIVTNKDYTPYAIKRDDDISKLCKSRNINFYNPEDYLLLPVGTIKKKDVH